MRHRKGIHKLGRTSAHRQAMMRNLAAALVEHERVETTLPKAKAMRGFVERLVTLGKRGDLHARRVAARDLPDRELLRKLFAELASRYESRPGGYTRVLKLGRRRGDQAERALIEFVDRKDSEQPTSDA